MDYPKMLYLSAQPLADATDVKRAFEAAEMQTRIVASADEERAAVVDGWSAEPFDFIAKPKGKKAE